ncbi:MAG: ATP-binding cassette domain-containing protein [Lachnospiraceae bacterium]
MEKWIAEIENVNLTLGKQEILKDISLHIEPGNIYGVVGKNGSGKSMLFKCMCGFIRPQSGKIRIMGKEIGKEKDFPENTGILIEAPGFIPYYSGYKNLKLLADLKGKIKKEQIEKYMIQLGLEPSMRKTVKKYSLGMKQRLGIVQAVMEEPELLIMDEPMNALDKEGIDEVRRFFKELRTQGKTILLTSHNFEDIQLLCDKTFEMEHGKLKEV